MSYALDFLSNRDLAIIIWLIPVIGWIFYNQSTRKAALGIFPFLIDPKILFTMSLVTSYVAVICYGLWLIGYWDVSLLKATIIWTFGSGIVGLFKYVDQRHVNNFFVNGIRAQLGIIVLVEYIATLNSFSLVFELISQPILTFLVLMQAAASIKKEHAPVENLMTGILSIFGVYLIFLGIYIVWTDPSFWSVATLKDFMLPIILSVALLPFFYFFVIFVNFERRFIGIEYKLKETRLQKPAKWLAVWHYAFDLKRLDQWFHELQIANVKTTSDLRDTFKRVRDRKHVELNPPEISANMGWSPFKAMKFPDEEILHSNHYKQAWADSPDWYADSDYLKLGETMLGNHISYRIEGNAEAATRLSLLLTVNDVSTQSEALECFAARSASLLNAICIEPSDDILSEIKAARDFETKSGLVTIQTKRTDWSNQDAFDFYFEIIHQEHTRSY